MELSDGQIERYSRNMLLPQVGTTGQRKLLSSKILVIGAGGLGSPALLYLAAAGVGTIGIVDGDCVDISNLQRQIIHSIGDLQKPKVVSAADKIAQLNPDITIKTYNEIVTKDNIYPIIEAYDFVIDGTDNFPTKFLINDACVLKQKPFSHAGIIRFQGTTFTYVPGSNCYRCVFDKPPPPGLIPTCAEAGILGVVAGIIGTIQATEALKWVLEIGNLLTNRVLVFDALEMNFREVKLKKNVKCVICGVEPTITELQDYAQPTCDLKSRN